MFGAAIIGPRPSRWFLRAGILGNTALIGIWLASRMSGLPFVQGIDHAEPIGVKDTVTVVFELFVIAGALVLVGEGRALSTRLRLSERTLAPLAAATALLIVPGLTSPAHEHDDSHMHGDNGHSHSELAVAAGHSHAEVADDHAHGNEVGGKHAHGDAEHAGDAMHHASAHSHETATPVSGRSAAAARAGDPSNPARVPGIKAQVRYGPFLLPPADFGGTAHYNRILSNVPKPCTDCYIVSMKPNMVYTDGRNANLNTGTMLHHAVWTRPNIPDTTCDRNSAIGSQGMRFFASGNERTEMVLPAGFGYRVGADPWNLIAEIMNHSDEGRAVYITLDVVYRRASEQLRNVTPVWMDIDNCGDSQYAVPAGKSNKLWTWRSTLTGRVVSTAGHVHDGGVKTVLTNEATKHEMCSSFAGYGTKPEFENTVESMSMCVWDRIGVVRRGENLGLRAFYSTTEPKSDVMGINIAFVYETDDLAGGTEPPDPSAREQAPPTRSGGHDHP